VFDWTYLDDGGNEIGRSVRFDDPEAAEDWIGTAWRDLAEQGIQHVELVDRSRERRVYRMGLDEG
jgi:hypothetical protein